MKRVKKPDSNIKSIKIDKNIPIPNSNLYNNSNTNRNQIVIEALNVIKIGESFEFPLDNLKITEKEISIRKIMVYCLVRKHFPKMKIVMRIIRNRNSSMKGFRIWRIK